MTDIRETKNHLDFKALVSLEKKVDFLALRGVRLQELAKLMVTTHLPIDTEMALGTPSPFDKADVTLPHEKQHEDLDRQYEEMARALKYKKAAATANLVVAASHNSLFNDDYISMERPQPLTEQDIAEVYAAQENNDKLFTYKMDELRSTTDFNGTVYEKHHKNKLERLFNNISNVEKAYSERKPFPFTPESAALFSQELFLERGNAIADLAQMNLEEANLGLSHMEEKRILTIGQQIKEKREAMPIPTDFRHVVIGVEPRSKEFMEQVVSHYQKIEENLLPLKNIIYTLTAIEASITSNPVATFAINKPQQKLEMI